jgi:hypothetical protein
LDRVSWNTEAELLAELRQVVTARTYTKEAQQTVLLQLSQIRDLFMSWYTTLQQSGDQQRNDILRTVRDAVINRDVQLYLGAAIANFQVDVTNPGAIHNALDIIHGVASVKLLEDQHRPKRGRQLPVDKRRTATPKPPKRPKRVGLEEEAPARPAAKRKDSQNLAEREARRFLTSKKNK